MPYRVFAGQKRRESRPNRVTDRELLCSGLGLALCDTRVTRLPGFRLEQSSSLFYLCNHKASEHTQSPTARSAARRWSYDAPRKRAQTGSRFGDAIVSRNAGAHCRSAQTESRITRTATTGTGSKQKNTDRQTRERAYLSVLHLSAGRPTDADSQGGPLRQSGAQPAHPNHTDYRLKTPACHRMARQGEYEGLGYGIHERITSDIQSCGC